MGIEQAWRPWLAMDQLDGGSSYTPLLFHLSAVGFSVCSAPLRFLVLGELMQITRHMVL